MDHDVSKKEYRRIRLYGNVQGLGFRPYVASLAEKHDVYGYVRNTGGAVEIGVEGSPEQLAAFLADVENPQLPFAVIKEIETLNPELLREQKNRSIEPLRKLKNRRFEILESEGEELKNGIFIPPDLPLCESCEKELRDPENRRYAYPLNSCVSCGPRFSIIKRLPYDRENITMAAFVMCPECQKEYITCGNRRHHAQTIGCNNCGPTLLYEGKDGGMEKQEVLEQAIQDLLAGKIVAIKGIGGYHLACLPGNNEAVRSLRVLKGREEKPFAVMFLNLEQVQERCYVSVQEKELLASAARPIVLLRKKKGTEKEKLRVSVSGSEDYFAEVSEEREHGVEAASIGIKPEVEEQQEEAFTEKEIAKYGSFGWDVTGENDSCGCFLPYTAIQIMLLEKTGPLVMTSANKSDSPLIKDDREMLEFFRRSEEPLFAGVLYHDRKILRRLDDSVAKIAAVEPQMIRRGRGYVPQPVFLGLTCERAVAAMGGDLKNSFCIASGGYAYISEYIGDLQEEETMRRFENTFEEYQNLLEIHPEVLVCDCHPQYFSSAFAKAWAGYKTAGFSGAFTRGGTTTLTGERGSVIAAAFAGKNRLPVLEVQHHHAHVASVMAEHHLTGRVLGVAFDGTGYGTDGSVWGGEFLVCDGADFRRAGHLKCFQQLGGDTSATDARKVANCLLYSEGLWEYMGADGDKSLLMAALSHHINTVQSSSMGRLFDAAASLLGICHYNSYEGKCAVMLEQAAARAVDKGKAPLHMGFVPQWEGDVLCFSAKDVLAALIESEDSEAAALGFHKAAAEMVVQGCTVIGERENIRQVALTGGVFQNRILLELAVKGLKTQGFEVFWNRVVPPNDGGIALGQVFIALQQ